MRPKQRPETPIPFTMDGLQQITRHIRNHFVHEFNPRCVDSYGGCVNEGTGCIYGCFLTIEDAIVSKFIESPIFEIYFDPKWENLLLRLQRIHDNKMWSLEPHAFCERIQIILEFLYNFSGSYLPEN